MKTCLGRRGKGVFKDVEKALIQHNLVRDLCVQLIVVNVCTEQENAYLGKFAGLMKV